VISFDQRPRREPRSAARLERRGSSFALADIAVTKNIAPNEIAQGLVTKGKASFSLSYRDTRLLLIRVPEDGGELSEGLASMTVGQRAATPTSRAVPMLNFHTEIHSNPMPSTQRGGSGLRPGFDAFALEAMLMEASYFVVALRKRPEADAQSAERISVGRARNKDVVLRHPSISKFHGWFQQNESGTMCVADADSKNKTRVNDVVIDAKVLVPLQAGDRVRFGSVDALLCAADTLWDAAHLRAAQARSRLGG
jgi:hypothetical protein